MKTLTIKNPRKYDAIKVVSPKYIPEIIGEFKDCFYFHSYDKTDLCIRADIPEFKWIRELKLRIADNGYIKLYKDVFILD